ncbi:WhiB family transcriptional regulator [Nocardioides sp. NPDC057767]|uniref:WhiB family transcriptional regulator n=1 Tax=unclassified Nocardioides TaxID=2615069 RepID=UPI00366ECEB7
MSTTWMREAACASPENRGMPWTTDTVDLPPFVVEVLRATCDGCPVRSACNSYALEERLSGGMWAGTDRDQVVSLSIGSKPVLGEQLELPLMLGEVIGEVFGDLDAPALDGAA